MNELTLFAFEGNEVRTIQKEGEPWFAGKDALLRKLPRQPREEATAPSGTPHQELLKRLELLK